MLSEPAEMTAARVEIERVGIVVPARNEELALPGCLRALSAAVASATLPVLMVVVLDSCTDESEAVVAAMLDSLSLPSRCMTSAAATVGGARREGVQHLLHEFGAVDPAAVWIATTDADSLVPTNWIAGHAAHARAGAEIVAGTVDVQDWTCWQPAVEYVYRRQYEAGLAGDGHGHIHGANLGIRADTYLALDGFRAVPHEEDVDLIRRAQAAGISVTWAMDIAVCTSARRAGRTSIGFAGHLRDIATRVEYGQAATSEG